MVREQPFSNEFLIPRRELTVPLVKNLSYIYYNTTIDFYKHNKKLPLSRELYFFIYYFLATFTYEVEAFFNKTTFDFFNLIVVAGFQTKF